MSRRRQKKQDSGKEDRLRPAEAAAACAKALGILALLSYAFYDSWLPFLLLAGPAAAFFLKREKQRRALMRKELLKKQFLSAGDLLCDYLRSGYAIENAVRKSLAELIQLWGPDSPIVREWETVGRELSMGTPIEACFLDFAGRTGIEEIRDFAAVFAAVKRTGGQIGDVLHAAADLLSERFRTEEQIRTMIAQKRFEQRIMDVMPLAILLYIRLSAPEMVHMLYATLPGRFVMTGCLAVYVLAFFWAERIVRIGA